MEQVYIWAKEHWDKDGPGSQGEKLPGDNQKAVGRYFDFVDRYGGNYRLVRVAVVQSKGSQSLQEALPGLMDRLNWYSSSDLEDADEAEDDVAVDDIRDMEDEVSASGNLSVLFAQRKAIVLMTGTSAEEK